MGLALAASAIIMDLLAMTDEDRYQAAAKPRVILSASSRDGKLGLSSTNTCLAKPAHQTGN
jgi:hypothetical protein